MKSSEDEMQRIVPDFAWSTPGPLRVAIAQGGLFMAVDLPDDSGQVLRLVMEIAALETLHAHVRELLFQAAASGSPPPTH